MTSQQASRLVIASLMITVLVTVFAEIKQEKMPEPKVFIAGGAVYLVLGMMSDFAPAVAGPFAILIAIAVVMNQGIGAFDVFSKKIGGNK